MQHDFKHDDEKLHEEKVRGSARSRRNKNQILKSTN